MTEYRDQFDVALRHWSGGDYARARQGFAQVTALDPTVSDAWLGLIASGDASVDTLRSAAANSLHLGRETRRHGWESGTLSAKVVCPKYVAMPVHSRKTIELAYVSALISGGQYQEAAAAMLAPELVSDTDPQWLHFLRVSLYYMTERWPDVLSTHRKPPPVNYPDPMVTAATTLMAATAAANMGRYAQGLDLLGKVPEHLQNPYIVADANLMRGWCDRGLDNEAAAQAAFEKAVVNGDRLVAATAALENPGLRLVVMTDAVIGTRTDPWDPSTAEDPLKVAAAAEAASRAQMLQRAEETLNEQVGIAAVKLQVTKLKARVRGNARRLAHDLPTSSRSLHMAFTGPPGTGKTTIARVVAQTYCGLGLLKTATVIEAKRKDFVGQHLGATAIKTDDLIDTAMDGVLFIDEAYTLIQTGLAGGDAFGREAVDTLLARMENDRDRLVVIIAGYDNEIDRFLAANEGLASRIPRRIRFPSYGPGELVQIAGLMAARDGFDLDPAAQDKLLRVCEYLSANDGVLKSGDNEYGAVDKERPMIDLVGNARFIRNLIEEAGDEQMLRLDALYEDAEPPSDSGAATQDSAVPGDAAAGAVGPDLRMITAQDMETALELIVPPEFNAALSN
ncbi:type VII secretion AAA-ATPase EccA [Mycobacteroides salmoniphilum]|uniref:type VII secretion AAA-ATPase EccA n=1 Tax=Mycobacteroides salmoniphilum TaxID=404941 RepID=UPI00356AB80E